MTVNSYAVIGTSSAGVEKILARFPADEQDAAIQFALALDMKNLDDAEVRPSRERPPRPPLEFCPPFTIEHRPSLTLVLDAEGRCAAHLLGPLPIRKRTAETAAAALAGALK